MLSIGVEMLPFELFLMDVGTLIAGYVLFRSNKKLAMNHTMAQVLGTTLIVIAFFIKNSPYEGLAGGIFVAGFLAKLGIFPFMWAHEVFSDSKAIVNLVICSQLSIILLMSVVSKEIINQNALLIFGLFGALFSSVSAIYDKKTKSALCSVLVAQTSSIFVSLSFMSPLSLLIAIVSDLLAKFTILFSEERRDEIAQILAAVYLAKLPPFPTFSEEIEILEMNLSIGVILNVVGILMMVALLMHRVKGGKSVGARAVGLILFMLGLMSLMKIV